MANVGFQRSAIGGHRLRVVSYKLPVEEVGPQCRPGRPLVAAGDDLDLLRVEGRSHHAMTARKAVLAAVAEMHLNGVAGPQLDDAPYAPLVFFGAQLPGLPARDSRCPLDLARDHVVAEIGRQQTQSVDFRGVTLGVGQADKSTQGDPAEPDGFATQRACRQHQLVPDTAQYRSVSQVLEVDIREHQVEGQAPVTHRLDEPRLYEIVRPRVRGGQKENPRVGEYTWLRRVTQRTHSVRPAPLARCPRRPPKERRIPMRGKHPGLPSIPAQIEQELKKTRGLQTPEPSRCWR